MRKSFSWLVFLLALSGPGRGTELTDLGQGLAYLRIHSVADAGVALRKSVPGAGALVLDLRYATADEASAPALQAAIAGRPGHSPLFVLVSPATPPALGPALTGSSILTLGIAGSVPTPKIRVQAEAADDRRAYDALDAGTELSKLITGKIEKERFDEASLVQEFKNGNAPAETPRRTGPIDRPGQTPPTPPAGTTPPPVTDPAAPTPAPAGSPASPADAPNSSGPATEKPTPPPTDRVLQRAVHLHRALQALRR